MNLDMTVAEGKDCLQCAHAAPWPPYPEPFRVCGAQAVVKRFGGPRYCGWMRRTDGLCRPEAKFYRRAK